MHGDLAERPLPEVCLELANQRASGRLLVDGPAGVAALTFHAGALTQVQLPDDTWRLGDRLAGAGSDGADTGSVRQARSRARSEALALLLQWRHGPYRFQPGAHRVEGEESAPEPVEVASALAAADELLRRREADRALLPHDDVVATPVPGLPVEGDALTTDDRTVLAALDGRRTLREVAGQVGYGVLDVAGIVADLLRRGVVQVGLPEDPVGAALEEALHGGPPPEPEPEPEGAAAPAAPPDQPVRQAQDADVSAFLRELSSLAVDDAQDEASRRPRRTDPPSAPAEDPKAKRRRGLFGRP